MLNDAYGIVGSTSFGDRTRFLRRAVPSAGGLFPLELYVVLRRVDGLEDGLYHYDVLGHSVRLVRRGDLFPTLEPMFYTYPFIQDANPGRRGRGGVRAGAEEVRSARVPLPPDRIGTRRTEPVPARGGDGARDAVHGGFVDSELNALLGLSPTCEGVMYTLAAGYDAEAPAPQR